MSFAGKWMELEILSEINQAHKNKHHMVFSQIWNLRKTKQKYMKVQGKLLGIWKGKEKRVRGKVT
jgi:hypothetical protein